MPIDVDVPLSPGWWALRLHKRMVGREKGQTLTRAARMNLLWNYFTGNPPLPRYSADHREDTKEFLRMARANYAVPVIDAMLDRTTLLGVRTGADGDVDGDDLARRIGTTNGLGALSQDVHAYAYVMSEGYVMVGQPDPATGLPVITAEDPRSVITAHDPLNPLRARAGIKVYRDEERERDMMHVFTPGRCDVAFNESSGSGSYRFNPRVWQWDEEESGPFPVEGADQLVPIHRFRNRFGLGEFEPHLDVLNRINTQIADRLWISKFQAFRQRAIEGALEDVDPETGEEIDYDDVFRADPGSFWRLPDGVKVWESQQVDMTPILLAVKDDVRELASVTRTPMHMFTPEATAGSAEGASLQREGIVFKADDRLPRLAPAWIDVYRTAFIFAGEPERARGDLSVMWAPTERFSLQQRGSAAVQAKQSGVPQQSIFSDVWQFPPDVVARMQRERLTDLLLEPNTPATPVADADTG